MRALAIARNTWREAIRDRVFVLVGAFGLLMVASSVFISPLTVGAQQKIVADMGLAAMSAFALLVALLVGSGMVSKEMDRRTIATLLSKPLSRREYLLGKYLGLSATILAMMATMAALFLVAVWLSGGQATGAYFTSMALSALEMLVVVAVVIFFSAITGPVLTSLFTLGVFIAGRCVGDLEAFARVAGDAPMARSLAAAKWLLPNLDLFNVRNAAVHGLPIEGGHLLWAVLYALMYGTALLALAELAFARKDFR